MTSNCVRRRVQLFCIFFSAVLAFMTSARAKPTLPFSITRSFQIPTFPSISLWTQNFAAKRQMNPMKMWTGTRISNDTLLMVYHHDQTIAITELGPDKLLIGCELIEINNDEDGKNILREFASLINRPLEISFDEMLKLMHQCDIVDSQLISGELSNDEDTSLSIGSSSSTDITLKPQVTKRGIFPPSTFTLLSGIIPGTKWCGTGDIATSYTDLGTETIMDRCCRTHDLCPKKVRAYQKRYDLMNDSLYTKSHCICDDMLFSCLKRTNSSAAQFMGSIYFNLVQVPCVHEVNGKYSFRNAREGF